MNHRIRCLAVGLLALFLASPALGQEFRLPYLKTPETPREFWVAVHYDLETGKHKQAAEMLKSFYEKFIALGEREQDDLLLSFYDEGVTTAGNATYLGVSSFLRLGNVPELRKVTARPAGADKELPVADILVARVSKLVGDRLGDAKRIDFFIRNLIKSPEERAYAINQLKQSGARAVPAILNALRDNARASEHQAILNALVKMNRDVVPPLLGGLEANDAHLRALIIDVLVLRGDKRAVPYLWYLYGREDQPEAIRSQATNALAAFLGKQPKEFYSITAGERDAREKLTQEATRFHQHQAAIPAGEQPMLWRWDEQAGLVGRPANQSQFEEYYGAQMAKLALRLDPAYRPAQIVLLSILLDKAMERGGPEQPLAKTDPGLQQLLAATDPKLLESVLDRALREGRTSVALGAARALALTNQGQLIPDQKTGLPPLARALRYPDRRVQLAAAEAILRVPSAQAPAMSSRVVEVLRRAVAGNGSAKALIGMANSVEAQKLSGMLRQWNYEPVVVANGQELIRAAGEAADLEVIFIEPRLPDPGLNHLLAHLAASADTAGVPLVILTPKDQEAAARSLAEPYARVLVVSPPPASAEMLKAVVEPFLKGGASKPLSAEERTAQAKTALEWLGRIARGELGERAGYDLRPAEPAFYGALSRDDLAVESAGVLAQRPGRQPQEALANLVLDDRRPSPVRAEAARQLRRHLQRFGNQLKMEQVAALVKTSAGVEDAELKAEAARVAAGLQRDHAAAGRLLQDYTPSQPAPKEEEKAKPKTEEPKQ